MSLRLCLLGNPLSHSLSPPMHRAAISFFGLDGDYELKRIETETLLAEFISGVPASYSGFNVTIPYKEKVFQLLKERSVEAELASAVNTVRLDSSGELLAHNTDIYGFVNALSASSFSGSKNSKLLILGSGGAARACLCGLLLSGFENLVLAARSQKKAEELRNSVSSKAAFLLGLRPVISLNPIEAIESPHEFSLVLNCTSLGLSENDLLPAWSLELFAKLNKKAHLFDTVYKQNQEATILMKLAIDAGLTSNDGLSMLVEQARFAFEFWTGRRPEANLLYGSIGIQP